MDQTQPLRRYFDAQAGSYDDYTGNGAWTPNQYLAGVLDTLAADHVEVRTALDLGTGTGQTLEVVRAAFPRAELWASDLSPAMLRRAALRVPDAHVEVADISGYVARLSRSFDLVTAVGCLEMVDDLPAVLPKLIRHVNPGGHLALTVQALIDGQGAEQVRTALSGDGEDQRWCYSWSTARLLRALPGGELRSSHLFTAYYRGEQPVFYELLLIGKR
ncbi:class I SAM-dependent methyltransferase [Jatrophihabitans sp.]|uniref:class I SAM-dependent methyltransferase n=1 Tax=Jatrophihabitans sp. TaxID=1932789 RepID=UPI002B7696AF|nr:class I SAM-dependent methyltransferase [Jatrophihabitans sp.]